MTWVARLLRAWPLEQPGPGEGSGVDDGGNGTGLTDNDVISSCLNVTKATVKKAIEYEKAITILAWELDNELHDLHYGVERLPNSPVPPREWTADIAATL